MKKLIDFSRIIVHPGKSHFDERLATALALANIGHSVPVYRREPTQEDLEDQETLVLDVGGQLDDWNQNFDHHQLPREHAPECAFSLVADAIGMKAELESFFGWFATWRMIDSKGPFQWAREHGVDWSTTSTLLNPENDLVGEWWEEASGDIPVDESLVRRLKKQGEKILTAAERFRSFCERADQQTPAKFNEVPVLDLTWASPNEALEFGDAYARSRGISGGVLVSRDNRGPGFALFRRNDDPKVNFAVLEGDERVSFAHKGGFIAKTKLPEGWRPLVEAAIKD